MSLAAATLTAPARPQEPSANKAWLRALGITSRIERAPERLLSSVVEEVAETCPDAPALLSDDEVLTYGDLARRITAATPAGPWPRAWPRAMSSP